MIAGARIGILVLVAAAAAWVITRPRAGGTGDRACPMHREVVKSGPGRCPICGMALEAVERPTADGPPRRRDESPVRADRFVSFGVTPVHRRALAAKVESPAWLDGQGGVTAALFEDELRDLGPGEAASFFAARAPGTPLAVVRAGASPVRGRGSTWLVRFRFRAEEPVPGGRVGSTGWVEWPARGGRSLVVVSSAVLHGAAGPYLMAVSADGRGYRRQPISTGRAAGGFTPVVSGASERDLVVGVNAFSIAAQAQLQGGP